MCVVAGVVEREALELRAGGRSKCRGCRGVPLLCSQCVGGLLSDVGEWCWLWGIHKCLRCYEVM